MTAALVLSIALSAGPVGVSSDLTYVGTWDGVSYPARVAPAPGGDVYVTDPPMKQVVRFGTGGAVVATYAVSQGPVGIAVAADGRVFVSREDGVIGIYDTTLAPLGTVNPAPFALSGPNDLAMHPTDNELYAVDSAAHRVLVFDATTGLLVRAWGMEGIGLGQFATPQAITVDTTLNRVIVTDADNFRVQVFDTTGILLFKFGFRMLYLPTTDVAWVARTEGVAVDSCGNIYLGDALMGTVRVFSSAGGELDAQHAPMIGYGTGAGQLRLPCDIAIDAANNLYVANTNNSAVEVFSVACAASAAAAVDDLRDDSPKHRVAHPKRPGDPRLIGGDLARVQAPDNPADIVPWINAVEYKAEYDLNGDTVVNRTDLAIAVEQFGAGTVEDFLRMGDGVANVDHPALEPPHILNLPNRCGRCHSMDGAPGGMLTAAGQENLCQSCHSAGKIAGEAWIGPGDSGMNHPWGVPADDLNPQSELALHLDNGNVRCATCHEPHNYINGTEYLRMGPLYEDVTVTVGGVQRPLTLLNPTLCGECHTDIVDQWHVAGHSDEHADPWVHYDWSASNRASCRKCHSGHGYIDFDNGVPEAQRSGKFRVADCLVCHNTHGESQDNELLRAYDTVVMPGNVTLTGVGSAATCMTCHNGRNAPADPGFTPHYLLGGAMLAGVNGITTFRGTTYSVVSSQHTQLMNNDGFTCATCHMAESPEAGNPGAGKVGGHTFNMAVRDPDDPDFGFENVASACGGCHTGLATFNRPAGGDYDGDGTVEGVQDEVSGLLDVVVNAIEATGAQQILDAQGHPTYPYWKVAECVGGTNPGATCTSNSNCQGGGTCVTVINPPADRPVVEDAIWNWEFVDNSSDFGIKNTGYAVGLLQVAYQGITGNGVPNASYRYSPAP